MRNNIGVIIPCFNARKTILQTIKNVLDYLPNATIFIVDDNSPDMSSQLVRRKFAGDKRVQLIKRASKQGRGSAVLMGFTKALKYKGLDFFVELDADLCHDAKYIPIMIKKCHGYDVVIASKYLNDSKIMGINVKRLLFSRIVNLYIRFILGVPITDFTNGFRCYRRKALEKIIFDPFLSKGFIVLSEIIYKLHEKGCSIGEIPFAFNFNKRNKSNFNLSEITEAFFTVLKLRFNIK